MFDHNHYVPILKGKDGEYRALKLLSPKVKEQFTPVIDVPPMPKNYGDGRSGKTLHQHISRIPGKIESSWGTKRPVFLDLYYAKPGDKMGDGRHPLR